MFRNKKKMIPKIDNNRQTRSLMTFRQLLSTSVKLKTQMEPKNEMIDNILLKSG